MLIERAKRKMMLHRKIFLKAQSTEMARRLLYIGGGLVVLATVVLLLIYLPVIRTELHYQLVTKRSFDGATDTIIASPHHAPEAPTVPQKPSAQVFIPPDTDFSIIIPKIGANASVRKDVDPYDPKAYHKALQQGIAHARGTSVPPQKGDTFLFAHSSENFYNAGKYNTVFYLLNKLTIGDRFYIVYENNVYVYRVTQTRAVTADAVQYLQNTTTGHTATLMTCWPPGTDAHRLLIIGTRERVEPLETLQA